MRRVLRRATAAAAVTLGLVLLTVALRCWPLGRNDRAYVTSPSRCVRIETDPEADSRLIVTIFAGPQAVQRYATESPPTLEFYSDSFYDEQAMFQAGMRYEPYRGYGDSNDVLLAFANPADAVLGFIAGSGTEPHAPVMEIIVVALPWWFAMSAGTAPAAALALRSAIAYARKRARARSGLCATCGYDVRATPERCPECGTVIGQRSLALPVP